MPRFVTFDCHRLIHPVAINPEHVTSVSKSRYATFDCTAVVVLNERDHYYVKGDPADVIARLEGKKL